MAALGLVAKVLEGKGGQVDISLFDVMLSQLNYKAAAYLNGGERPARQPLGAHAFYVPAQLFETSVGLPGAVRHAGRVLAPALRTRSADPHWADDPRFATMHAALRQPRRAARRARAPRRRGVRRPSGSSACAHSGSPSGRSWTSATPSTAISLRSRGVVVSVDTDGWPVADGRKPHPVSRATPVPTTARRRGCTSTQRSSSHAPRHHRRS